MGGIIELFIRAAVRVHYEYLSDYCQECNQSGEQILAARPTPHSCTKDTD